MMRALFLRRHGHRPRAGFTLIELSIVLTIIGLVASAILVGQNMIRSAELRSVAGDLRKIQTVLGAFKEKYGMLPGDLSNATGYWGTAGGTGVMSDSACINAQTAASNATCNGNGNGFIGNIDGSQNRSDLPEIYTAWKQLVAAGMYEGSFSGIAGGNSTNNSTPGVNVPPSRISGAGYTLEYEGSIPTGNAGLFPADYGNMVMFGLPDGTHETYLPTLTNEEAASLDAKIDDGTPGNGVLITTINASCETTSNPATAQYITATKGWNCILYFLTGY